MPLSREDLRNQLRRGEIAPVYLLFGPETHLRDLAAKTIRERSFAAGDFRDFNESSFSLNTEDNLKKALAAAEQLPMLATKRVVTVADIRVTATGFRDTLTEADESILNGYLSNPSPHSVVIFVADELNGNRKITKLLKAHTVDVEFTPLDDRGLAEWARIKVKEAGAEIDEVTLRQLIARVGADVHRLTNEVNKLAAAALPDTRITGELINALVANTREITNFVLTDHLVAGRRSQALSTLEKILDDGAEPVALVGLISYNYRRLLMAKDMMERGVDRREVATVAKLRYSDQEPFLAAARRASRQSLAHAIEKLAKTDVAIKTSIGGSGPAGARLQIEMLVCELATI